MSYKYVVIEREYGSGGTSIGKQLSEATGIPCYGYEILQSVSEKMELPVTDIQQYEESNTNSFLHSIYVFSKINSDLETDFLSNENYIFLEEQKLVKEYAMGGPAIFVGRCAAYALEKSNVLKVYIHADVEKRKNRAIHEYGINEKMAGNIVAKFDRKRKNFYEANTGKKWNDWSNYDIILDSGNLGIETCVKMIQAVM